MGRYYIKARFYFPVGNEHHYAQCWYKVDAKGFALAVLVAEAVGVGWLLASGSHMLIEAIQDSRPAGAGLSIFEEFDQVRSFLEQFLNKKGT